MKNPFRGKEKTIEYVLFNYASFDMRGADRNDNDSSRSKMKCVGGNQLRQTNGKQ